MCLCLSVRQKSRSLGDKLGDSGVARVMRSASDDGECLSAWYSQASEEVGENEGCNSSITAAIWMIHYVIVCDWTPTIMPDCRCWLPPALSFSIFHLRVRSPPSVPLLKYECEQAATWTSYLSFTNRGEMICITPRYTEWPWKWKTRVYFELFGAVLGQASKGCDNRGVNMYALDVAIHPVRKKTIHQRGKDAFYSDYN